MSEVRTRICRRCDGLFFVASRASTRSMCTACSVVLEGQRHRDKINDDTNPYQRLLWEVG